MQMLTSFDRSNGEKVYEANVYGHAIGDGGGPVGIQRHGL
jgi:hypothetical protein